MPNIEISIPAVIIASIACFFLSYFWFGVAFAKTWAKETGLGEEAEPQGKAMIRGLLLTFVGIVFMVFVLSNNLAVWQPSTWGLESPQPAIFSQALSAAFFLTLGFIVPEMITRVAWEKHSWKLFAINVGYYFVSLLIAALILLLVRF